MRWVRDKSRHPLSQGHAGRRIKENPTLRIYEEAGSERGRKTLFQVRCSSEKPGPLFANAALRVTGVALRVADADLRFRTMR
jgi:hypothetical protein